MRTLVCTAIVLGAPRVALACPVCFGQNDSPMANAMNAGILFMLGVVAMILVGFGSFIYYLSRRASLIDVPGSSTIRDQVEAAPYVRSHPQEGTAQC
jgi:hypothetical protein